MRQRYDDNSLCRNDFPIGIKAQVKDDQLKSKLM